MDDEMLSYLQNLMYQMKCASLIDVLELLTISNLVSYPLANPRLDEVDIPSVLNIGQRFMAHTVLFRRAIY